MLFIDNVVVVKVCDGEKYENGASMAISAIFVEFCHGCQGHLFIISKCILRWANMVVAAVE